MNGFLRKALGLSAFFIALLFQFFPSVHARECSPAGQGQQITGVTVVDGDTLRVSGLGSMRLAGINTPEIGYDGAVSQPLAERARERLEELVADANQLVWFDAIEKRDRYKRRLGYLVIDGRPVAETLVSEGLAWLVAIEPNTELTECLIPIERSARMGQIGVWRDSPVSAHSIERGGFSVIYGTITRVDPGKRVWFVELDDRVAVRIPVQLINDSPELKKLFSLNQRIEIRGWLVDRSDRLSNPKHKPFLLSLNSAKLVQSFPE